PSEVRDDRDDIQQGDRVVLIVEDDPEMARTELDVARERGFKGIVALRGDSGLALAHEYNPDAIILDMILPVMDGWSVLDRLKQHPDTRHIPVHIVSGGDGRQNALRAGAVAFVEKPVSKESLEETFGAIRTFIDREVKRLLVVEDNEDERTALIELIGGGDDDVEVTAVGSGDEALEALQLQHYDCLVVDLKLPKRSGFELLRQTPDVDLVLMDIMMPELDGYETTQIIRADDTFKQLPIISLTAKAMKGDREKAIAAGGSDYITKPVDTDQLLSLMRVWLYK